jgi:hypothetical protein
MQNLLPALTQLSLRNEEHSALVLLTTFWGGSARPATQTMATCLWPSPSYQPPIIGFSPRSKKPTSDTRSRPSPDPVNFEGVNEHLEDLAQIDTPLFYLTFGIMSPIALSLTSHESPTSMRREALVIQSEVDALI